MTDLVEWLNGCYDRAERQARAVARSVGEHHYAPVEAPQYDDTSARWTARRWLYAKKVSAEDGRQWWRDEGPKVTDDVWSEVADHIADHDPSWRLADIARKRAILDEHADQHECTDLRGAEYPYVGCTTVRLLAEEFAGEPGYDDGWRP